MKKILIPSLLSLIILTSCAKKSNCNCQEEWEEDILYQKGALVLYHDTCWYSVTTAIHEPPGPWFTTTPTGSNDIWKPCIEH
jgi:hypothetical protein